MYAVNLNVVFETETMTGRIFQHFVQVFRIILHDKATKFAEIPGIS